MTISSSKQFIWTLCECRFELRVIIPIARRATLIKLTFDATSSFWENLLKIKLLLDLEWVEFAEYLVGLYSFLLLLQNFFEHLFIRYPSRYLFLVWTHVSHFLEVLKAFVSCAFCTFDGDKFVQWSLEVQLLQWFLSFDLKNLRCIFIVDFDLAGIIELSITANLFTVFFWHQFIVWCTLFFEFNHEGRFCNTKRLIGGIQSHAFV